jgi:hypothetical protein
MFDGYTAFIGTEQPVALNSAASSVLAKGGIWLLVQNRWAPHCSVQISTENYCWFVIKRLLPLPLYLAIVYMPKSSQLSEHLAIYAKLRKEKEQLQRSGYVMILGDFNARSRRKWRHHHKRSRKEV